MLIGRSDDSYNPCRVAAAKVTVPFGSGSRNPSGPAAPAAPTGRTHDRNRTAGFFRLTPCTQGPSTRALRPAPSPRVAWSVCSGAMTGEADKRLCRCGSFAVCRLGESDRWIWPRPNVCGSSPRRWCPAWHQPLFGRVGSIAMSVAGPAMRRQQRKSMIQVSHEP
jgi:hypothetical protein